MLGRASLGHGTDDEPAQDRYEARPRGAFSFTAAATDIARRVSSNQVTTLSQGTQPPLGGPRARRVPNKGQVRVLAALRHVEEKRPCPIRGIG